MKPIGRLHVLTDVELQSRFSHLELARLAIAGGADTIQLRQKAGSTRGMIEVAREMKTICAQARVAFIVNDRVDVAIASGADGVHLGQDDFPIPLARKLLGAGSTVGGSASTLEDARKCWREGADYIGLGPVYATSSKSDAALPCGIGLLRQVASAIPLPLIAIGGVQVDNTPELLRAGAHGIAVISAVCCQEDPEGATRRLRRALEREEVAPDG